MQMNDLKKGMRVFWNDPDDALCSGYRIIASVNRRDGSVTFADGTEALIGELESDRNPYGVPYHPYQIHLADHSFRWIDISDEDDWGNIQRCITDRYTDHARECPGWGDADNWVEIDDVIDLDTNKHLEPLKWANECVWIYADLYAA